MDGVSKQHEALTDELSHIVAINPNLTLDELNVVLEHKAAQRNSQPIPEFCGLSPNQMQNWLYDSFNQLEGLNIHTPDDLSKSPVMRYLELILEEAMQNGGSFKSTAKGNLPAKLAKQASAILPELSVSQLEANVSISDYAGSNEDKFRALHYTRVLAELAGIIYRRSGKYHLKKAAQKQYEKEGLKAFFKRMLEAATTQYNWGYLDLWQQNFEMNLYWVFMLCRIKKHSSVDQLVEEMMTAFPDLLLQLEPSTYQAPKEQFQSILEVRFLDRFLQYWGFIIIHPIEFANSKRIARKTQNQPLFEQTFEFNE